MELILHIYRMIFPIYGGPAPYNRGVVLVVATWPQPSAPVQSEFITACALVCTPLHSAHSGDGNRVGLIMWSRFWVWNTPMRRDWTMRRSPWLKPLPRRNSVLMVFRRRWELSFISCIIWKCLASVLLPYVRSLACTLGLA